jgi:hypothetical protein
LPSPDVEEGDVRRVERVRREEAVVFHPLGAEVEVVLDHGWVEELWLALVVKMGSLLSVVMSIEVEVAAPEDVESVEVRIEELPGTTCVEVLVFVETVLMLQPGGTVHVLV